MLLSTVNSSPHNPSPALSSHRRKKCHHSRKHIIKIVGLRHPLPTHIQTLPLSLHPKSFNIPTLILVAMTKPALEKSNPQYGEHQ